MSYHLHRNDQQLAMSRSFYTTALLAATSGLLQGATAAIMICLAIEAHAIRPAFALALSAAILDILALAPLLVVTACVLRRKSQNYSSAVWVLSAVFGVSGAALSLATSSYTFSRAAMFNDVHDRSVVHSLSVPGLALPCCGLASQVGFLAWIWTRPSNLSPASPNETLPYYDEAPSAKRRLSMVLSSLAWEQCSPSGSVLFSKKKSLGHAIDDIPQSRSPAVGLFATKVYSSPAAFRSSTPTEPPQCIDEFEGWETGSIQDEPQGNSAFRSFARHRLSTIPGSRPASAGLALDGPFPDPAPDSLPESPLDSPLDSPPGHFATTTNFDEETSSRHSSSRPPRTLTPSVSETHIHPLFRAESSVPPPLVSPGTTITASPYAGQVIGPDHALAPRVFSTPNGSRTASPALGPMRSRPGSSNAHAGLTALPPCPSQVDLGLPPPLRRQSSTSNLGRVND